MHLSPIRLVRWLASLSGSLSLGPRCLLGSVQGPELYRAILSCTSSVLLQMVHLVDSVLQHIYDRVTAAGVWLEQARMHTLCIMPECRCCSC